MNSKLLYGTGLALAGLYLFIGCTSTTTGNEGNLDFSYTADDDLTNFNKPVAVGARLELKVRETGSRHEVEILDASSDDPGVLEVDTFASNRIIILGAGEGEALIEVTAETRDGDETTDSVNMLAAVPDVLKLRHTCRPGEQLARYFVDTDDVRIAFDLEKSNGQPVIGYGYHPIEVSGDAELDLHTTSTDQANFHFDIGGTPGPATIASTIDDASLDVDVVVPADIDAVEASTPDAMQLHVGETKFFHFFPAVESIRVCQSQEEVQAESASSATCTVSAVNPPEGEADAALDLTGWVKIEGLEPGLCEFTVTYPDANGGQGVTQEFEAEVTDAPESSNNSAEM